MKRIRKNLSVFCILALMLSFFGGNLIVHAEPDGGHSDTDSTPVITDVVDGENAKAITLSLDCYDKETGTFKFYNGCVFTVLDDYKVIFKQDSNYYPCVFNDEIKLSVISESAETDLATAFTKAEVVKKNDRINVVLPKDGNFNVLVFSDNKCIANASTDSILSMIKSDIVPSTVNVTSSGWTTTADSDSEDDTEIYNTITIKYNMGSINGTNDAIENVILDGKIADIGEVQTGAGSVDIEYSINCDKTTIPYIVETEFQTFTGEVELGTPPEQKEMEKEDSLTGATITFSEIPKSVAYGETFKLTVSSDQPVILQFDSALLNKSEKDYIKEAEVEISRNGVYSYVAKNQDGVVVTGTLEINCFEDDVTDNDTDDSYWNGVDDSSKKLAQTGLYNNPIFYIISFMLVAGIALIVYVLKFRKRGANNE